MNTTSKASGHEETFHTDVVVRCTDDTKLLALQMVKRKTVFKDKIPCNFSYMSSLLDERVKRNEAVAMESVNKMSSDLSWCLANSVHTKWRQKTDGCRFKHVVNGNSSQLQPSAISTNGHFTPIMYEEWT
jgi:hypothetical protein